MPILPFYHNDAAKFFHDMDTLITGFSNTLPSALVAVARSVACAPVAATCIVTAALIARTCTIAYALISAIRSVRLEPENLENFSGLEFAIRESPKV